MVAVMVSLVAVASFADIMDSSLSCGRSSLGEARLCGGSGPYTGIPPHALVASSLSGHGSLLSRRCPCQSPSKEAYPQSLDRGAADHFWWFSAIFSSLPPSLYFHILRILERQKRHKIGVMHNERFGRALHQIALGRVRGDDVAHCVRHAALHRQRDSSKRMPQCFSALALPALPVRTDLILQQLADVRQNRTCNYNVRVDGQRASHEVRHRFRTVARNMHDADVVIAAE